MIKVALVTTWPPELCGIASHSTNIVRYRAPDVEYRIIQRPFAHDQILGESVDCPIVHFSYEWGLHGHIPSTWIDELKVRGQKVVCTFHNIWPDDGSFAITMDAFTRKNATVRACDAVVVQDPHTDPTDGFIYIPQGVMEVPKSEQVEPKIGTAGFPSEAKGAPIMARVARELGLGFLLFAPISRHADAHGMAEKIRQQVPQAEVVFDFLPQEQIATRLSECVVTVWAYKAHYGQSGISGSVRLGVAAGRPMVITRCGMYRDLWQDWEDEIYVIPADTPTFENMLPVVQEALKGEKRPNRILKEHSWKRCGELYRKVYGKLLGLGD